MKTLTKSVIKHGTPQVSTRIIKTLVSLPPSFILVKLNDLICVCAVGPKAEQAHHPREAQASVPHQVQTDQARVETLAQECTWHGVA